MKNPVIQRLVRNLGRFDSNETIFFSRELETIDPTAYMELYAGLVGRSLVPRVANVDPLDLTYTYRMWKVTGTAKVGGPHANDGGVIGISAVEASTPIKKIPLSYGWGVDEIRQAAKKGVSLDQQTVMAAMSMLARKVDDMIAFGEANTNITGLLNNASVNDSDTPVTKTPSGTVWTDTSTPGQMIADIVNLVSNTRKALKQASNLPGGDGTPAFDRFVIGLPSFHYNRIATTPRSDFSDTTCLTWLLENVKWIESLEEWWKLDTADDGDPMIVCYPRNPMALGALIPREFESLEPQAVGQDIVVPASGTCGGVVIRYAVACRYLKDV